MIHVGIMCIRIIKLRLSLRAVVNDESIIKSSDRDQLDINNTWEMAEQVTTVLEPLAEATEIMGMEQVPTLSCVHVLQFCQR